MTSALALGPRNVVALDRPMTESPLDSPGRAWRNPIRTATLIAGLTASLLALVIAAPAGAHRSRRHHGHRPCKWENAHASQVGVNLVRRAILCLINHQRADHRLPQFRVNGALNSSSQNWANTMVATGNSGNGDLAAQISATGYNWSQAGSVVGSGFPTASKMVAGWMGDPAHCEVILDPVYRNVGTGVNARAVRGFWRKGATYTEDYGLSMGQSPASGNWGPADGCPY
jgi:uncharacterized protein YkwD